MSEHAIIAPESFAGLWDCQEFMASHLGGEAKDYFHGKSTTREAATKLGILAQWEASVETMHATDGQIASFADRFNRREANAKGSAMPAYQRSYPSAPVAAVEPLPGFPVSEVWGGYTPPSYIVKSILAPAELTVIYGQSQHFKSVVAVELSLCVGTGIEYHGHRVRRAGVLYVAGEGHAGIKKRIRAWMMTRGMNAASEQPAVYVTSAAADLIGGVNLGVKDPHLARTLLDLSQTATLNDSLKLGKAVLGEIGGINELHKGHVEQAGFAQTPFRQ
jgi:hypothetical protein